MGNLRSGICCYEREHMFSTCGWESAAGRPRLGICGCGCEHTVFYRRLVESPDVKPRGCEEVTVFIGKNNNKTKLCTRGPERVLSGPNPCCSGVQFPTQELKALGVPGVRECPFVCYEDDRLLGPRVARRAEAGSSERGLEMEGGYPWPVTEPFIPTSWSLHKIPKPRGSESSRVAEHVRIPERGGTPRWRQTPRAAALFLTPPRHLSVLNGRK